MKDKTTIFLGPPGTGKTTRLLKEIEDLFQRGVDPSRVAFLAFTRKAATEAKERAKKRFDYPDESYQWFRTIHSTAFKQIGGPGGRLMHRHNYKQVLDRMGMDFGGDDRDSEDESTWIHGSAGDALIFLDNLSRVTERSPIDVFEERISSRPTEDVRIDDLTEFSRLLREYKLSNALIDYTDALEQFLATGPPPVVDVLVVDEAQDLSRLQWRVIEKIANRVKIVMVAGDDDQAIFRWAGADVDHFLELQGDAKVLDESHRVPSSVHALAKKLLSRISRRRLKDFKPRDFAGEVSTCNDDVELDASKGEWLMLARHGYQLRDLENLCRGSGWFYEKRGDWSNDTDTAKAILAWENWRRGASVKAAHAVLALEAAGLPSDRVRTLPPEAFVDSPRVAELARPWTEILDLPPHEAEYVIQARRSGEIMARKSETTGRLEPVKPRIRISTIHGAKGGEAEGVYLSTGVSLSTYESMQRSSDDETRVFYVGVTRSLNKLVIRTGDTLLNYPMTEELT